MGPPRVGDLSATAMKKTNSSLSFHGILAEGGTTSFTEAGTIRRSASRVEDVAIFLNRFVIPESHLGRKAWNFALFIMLLYIGIVFPYRLAFLHFKLQADPDECTTYKDPLGWHVWEHVVTGFFWVDLFLNFFMTHRNELDLEETDVRNIARHYLSRLFVFNLIACLPEQAFRPLLQLLKDDTGGCGGMHTANQAGRLVRLQRATRLGRLSGLTRLTKIFSFVSKDTGLMRHRSVRMFNWIFLLSWVVHITACGWYLCAAFHSDHSETWVARRSITAEGDRTLLTADSDLQWAHSMYFVLTVFTTVGFGDMSAMTAGEIKVVCAMMIGGIIINSIVIGEVINLVSEVDGDTRWRREQQHLLESYGEHASLSEQSVEDLKSFIKKVRSSGRTYDSRAVRTLMTTENIPRNLLGNLPAQLFKGLLIKNKLITTCALCCPRGVMPPRFTILLSTMLRRQSFKDQEVVYQVGDNAFNLYLVLSGTFASVGQKRDGVVLDAAPFPDSKTVLYVPSRSRRRIQVDESHALKDREERFVLNPPGTDRRYSSSECWRVRPQLGQESGAWSPESEEGEHWMQFDLGSVRPVCGVIIQGHPLRHEWVTQFRVQLSAGSASGGPWDWEDVAGVCTGCVDWRHEHEVAFMSREARHVRIEPVSWHGKASMRAGVVVHAPRLSPYLLFGRQQFFGHELLTKDTRQSTVRCERSGEVLQLHKGHLLADASGDESLLAEFPQFARVLRADCKKRDAQRLRALRMFTPSESCEDFAAIIVQRSWRRSHQSAEGRARTVESDLIEAWSGDVACHKAATLHDLHEQLEVAALKRDLARHAGADFKDLDAQSLKKLRQIITSGSPAEPSGAPPELEAG